MEKFSWTYQQLLDTPQYVIDVIMDIMKIEADKQKFDAQAQEMKHK